MIYDDVAAIHTGTGAAATVRDSSCANLTIKQNIIHTPAKLSAEWLTRIPSTRRVGIYLDNETTDVDLDGNVIYDDTLGGQIATEGIYFWTGVTDIRIFNNIVKDYGTLCMSGVNSATIKNIKVYDNVFCQNTSAIITIYASYYGTGGYLDRNKYINTLYTSFLKLLTTSYDLAGWRTATGQDANSTYMSPVLDIDLRINLTAIATLVNFAVSRTDLDNNSIDSITLQPYTGRVVLGSDTPLENILLKDNFAGTTIDIAKWTETDPNSVISQNNNLILTLTHASNKAEFVNNLISVPSIASGIAVVQGHLTWTGSSNQEAIGGIYLYADANNFAAITSHATASGSFYRLRIKTGGVSRYDITTTSTYGKDKDVKIWTDGTNIKFYYHYGAPVSWLQMGTTQAFALGYPLYYCITCQDNTLYTAANPINIDNAFLSTIDYATRFP